MKLAIAGSSGFIGQSIKGAARVHGWTVAELPGVRVQVAGSVRESALRWLDENPGTFDALRAALHGSSALVNASGLAMPASSDSSGLLGANAVTPAILAHAAEAAGVPRFIHISSASVQGKRALLDESCTYEPLGAYARSKVAGEATVMEPVLPAPGERVIYRPTSVQGVDRRITQQLVKLAEAPALPLCGNGSSPVPLALVENVAAAVLHLVETAHPPTIALHPWEGMTVRRMFEAFGTRRFVPMAMLPARAVVAAMYGLGHSSDRMSAYAQRLRLVTIGQEQDARWLEADGFQLPLDVAGYADLARHYRRPPRMRRSTHGAT